MEKSTELGGSEQASSSDDGQLVLATVRKFVQNEFELMGAPKVCQLTPKEVGVMVIRAVQQVLPTLEDRFRKVAKQEIDSALEKYLGVNRSNERFLLLKFLHEVSLPVLTGKHIKGKGDTHISVALVDLMSEEVVKSRAESWGTVEIFLLDDNDHKWRPEDFNNRIIKEGDKTKPHFAKRVYVKLVDGIGIVDNAKLGHDSKWMKKFECRLGARMENFNGVKVKEAWTESFVVSDRRGKIQRKSIIPSLSDRVRILKNIDDACCQHLNDNNIKTVKDFLFMQSIDPQKLQQIAFKGAKWEAESGASAKWEAALDHAQTCIIDDKRFLYYESSDINWGIAFNVVGGLRGAIEDFHFIPYDELSDKNKDSAHKLLRSAYENQKDIKSFEDEDALLCHFPQQPRGVYRRSLSPSLRLDNCSKTCGDKHNEPYPHQQKQSCTILFGIAKAALLWILRVRNRAMLYHKKGKRSMALELGVIHVQKRLRTD